MTDRPANVVVWSEIPVTDMERAKSFYGTVLQQELTDEANAPNPMANFTAPDGAVSGHIYPGRPAPRGTGNTVHLAAPGGLEATMERVKQAGGEVTGPAMDIPPGRFSTRSIPMETPSASSKCAEGTALRRADRLFRLVQTLRGGRLWTAARLAEAMEVSQRTTYRDVADLQASGVPIDGEAGVGYVMRDGFDLPPLMFTREEIAALALGARLVSAWGGTRMARSAHDALAKIDEVLDGKQMNAPLERLFAPSFQMKSAEREAIDLIDTATRDRVVLRFAYTDGEGRRSDRSVRPLALWFWGVKWTLVAWCELRKDFRMFRTDRLSDIEMPGRTFLHEPGRTIADFLAAAACEEGMDLPTDPFL